MASSVIKQRRQYNEVLFGLNQFVKSQNYNGEFKEGWPSLIFVPEAWAVFFSYKTSTYPLFDVCSDLSLLIIC